MKTKHVLQTLGLIALGALASSSLDAAPFGSAFTYQGRLNFSGAPAADGLYDFTFTLHDASTGGSLLGGGAVALNNVPVSNGVFTAHLSFGSTPFTSGEARWLELSVNTNGTFPQVTLSPRQRLSPTPQAIYAGNAATASAVAPGAVTSAGLAPASVNSATIADGSIGAADLSSGLLNGTFWNLTGNTGAGNFLGSVDNQPVELRVNNQPALRLLPNATSPNLIGGHAANFVNSVRSGAFIGGGGSLTDFNVANANYASVVGGQRNRAVGDWGAIGGGLSNNVEQLASVVSGGALNAAGRDFATVGGGFRNTVVETNGTIGGGSGNFISGDQGGSTIGGGRNNFVIQSQDGTIAGGLQNHITGSSATAAIGGGYQNFIETNGFSGTIAGGYFNLLSEYYAVIGGGHRNAVHGDSSTIAGGSRNYAASQFASIGGGQNNTNSGTGAVVAGGSLNRATDRYAVIGGGLNNLAGGEFATIAGGNNNRATTTNSTIGGGRDNSITGNAAHRATISGGQNSHIIDSGDTVIAGGLQNRISEFSNASSVGGGYQNFIEEASFSATIPGGAFNLATSGNYGAIAGGSGNVVRSADYATIGGGRSNTISGDYAIVPGGLLNAATGNYSLAAGRRAKANHSGSFVWADDTDADFASTTNKQFAVRANNGVMIQSSATALDLRGGGALRVAGAGVNTATPIFTHRATSGNTSGSETRIAHPHCDGKPGAILIVTYNFNPAGLAGTRNDRPVGIYYTGTQWAIYNLDGTAMPVGAAYNVLVANP